LTTAGESNEILSSVKYQSCEASNRRYWNHKIG